jgi:hypothetical protein
VGVPEEENSEVGTSVSVGGNGVAGGSSVGEGIVVSTRDRVGSIGCVGEISGNDGTPEQEANSTHTSRNDVVPLTVLFIVAHLLKFYDETPNGSR